VQGDTTTTGYDGIGLVTCIVSPNGNLTEVTDPLGHTTGTSYDEANEPYKVTQPDATVLLTGYDRGATTAPTAPLSTSAIVIRNQARKVIHRGRAWERACTTDN